MNSEARELERLRDEIDRLEAENEQLKDRMYDIATEYKAKLARVVEWCEENPSQWIMRADVLAALTAEVTLNHQQEGE